MIQVDGKSMQPHINDKALVVADLSQKEFENNGIFLVYKDDKMWIKKALIIDEKEFLILKYIVNYIRFLNSHYCLLNRESHDNYIVFAYYIF